MAGHASSTRIKAELDSLERQFGSKATLNLEEYAELMSIKRRKASVHVRAHGVPFVMIGQRKMLIPVSELALYLAKKKAKAEGQTVVEPVTRQDMKSRRGFSQMANKLK